MNTISFLLAWTAAVSVAEPPPKETPKTLCVYVGTYTGGGSGGIYRCRLDLSDGTLQRPTLAAEARNPSFLALHPTRPVLYAVSELYGVAGGKSGAVSTVAIQPKTGDLKLLNQQPTGGAGTCHVAVDRGGRCVLAADYGSGSVACLPGPSMRRR